MNFPNTFLKLIENYTIEIPIIQRDYAQGREDAKTEEIRKKFVDDLINVLNDENKDETKQLNLDFIYGPIENNVFIPLDGQQRLTTLFLLHWYVLKKSKNINLNLLAKFKYKVRVTTQEFLDALLDKEKGGDVSLEKSPKDEITDASWYYSSWDYDPTIQGMLVMLNCIHEHNITLNNAKNNLDNITFNMLPMNEFKLTDELYMRMNARGLALTPFENFKSWLEGEVKGNDNNWKENIDKKWTDLIWKLADGNSETFDRMFMQYFNQMAQYVIATHDYDFEKQKDQDNYKKEIIGKLDNSKAVPFSVYKDKGNNCFTKDSTQLMFSMLDFCDKYHKDENKNLELGKGFFFDESTDIFTSFLSKEANLKQRVCFYAFFKYAEKRDWCIKNFSENLSDFKNFKRVIRNLVENTSISTDAFSGIIKSIQELVKHDDILEYLINHKDYISGFTKKQITEESLKAKLIKSGSNWENAICEAENLPFFKGHITCLLKKIINDTLSDVDTEDSTYFQENLLLAEKLWNKKGSIVDDDKNFLLIRAIFYFSPEIPLDLIVANNRNNWIDLLEKKEIQEGLIKLFEKLSPNLKVDDLKKHLESLINYCNDKNPVWMLNIIKYGHQLLKISRDKKIKSHYGPIYVYEKNYSCGGDILISETATPRNNLINKLIDAGFIFDADWRKNKHFNNINFYKGHDIGIHKNGINDKRILLKTNCVIIQTSKDQKEWQDLKQLSFNEKTIDELKTHFNFHQ